MSYWPQGKRSKLPYCEERSREKDLRSASRSASTLLAIQAQGDKFSQEPVSLEEEPESQRRLQSTPGFQLGKTLNRTS
jgi:hypothetical protein